MLLKRGWIVPLLILLILASFGFPFGAPTVKASVLYDSGNPTPEEQLVLEYINRARADPIAEGQRLGIDIHEGLPDPSLVGPRPPLAMNKLLLGIAETHSQNMYNQNYFSHNDPNGMTPFDRMINAGYDYVTAGENMGGGLDTTATELEDLVMVDAGTPGRGHRVNLLDLFNPYPCGGSVCVYYEVGVGYYGASAPNGIGLNSLLTQDFGTTNVGPFLLGVVYNDLNHNNFYDIGEGIGGVTITPSAGSYYAVSSSSGGYAIPIGTSGTITVTASGPGFDPITKTVTLNGANIKVDFTTSSQASSTIATSTTQTSTLTSATSTRHFTTTSITSSTTAITTTATSTQATISTIQTTSSTSSSQSSTTQTSATSTSSQMTQTSQIITATSSTTTTSSSTQSTLQESTTSTIQTSTTNSPMTTQDFLLSASSNAVNLAQSSTGILTVSVQSFGTLDQKVRLQAIGLPDGVNVSFSPNPLSPSGGGMISSTVTLIVTHSVPTGIYPFTIVATSGYISKRVGLSLHVSGCLIATATFGSELAPEVQFLRDFRDDKILRTFAGRSFMVAFNTWYYSFSPGIAQYESVNPTIRVFVKIAIYPLIWILQVGSIVFDAFSFNYEVAAVLSGLAISSLLGAIYFTGPMIIVRRRRSDNMFRRARRFERASVIVLAAALLILTMSEALKAEMLMAMGSSIVVMSAIASSALWISRTATTIHRRKEEKAWLAVRLWA